REGCVVSDSFCQKYTNRRGRLHSSVANDGVPYTVVVTIPRVLRRRLLHPIPPTAANVTGIPVAGSGTVGVAMKAPELPGKPDRSHAPTIIPELLMPFRLVWYGRLIVFVYRVRSPHNCCWASRT